MDKKSFDSKDTKLDELIYLSLLYDFYGELLNDNKKRVFEDYILNDLSLSEIADQLDITRQGVHDMVKRCTKELKDYEHRLALVGRFTRVKHMLGSIKELCLDISQSSDVNKIQAIETLADDILKEL
jgi:predicted DNA-binding protein YlxM (UPF0122 family)